MSTHPVLRIVAAVGESEIVRDAAARFHAAATVRLISPDAVRRLERAECLVVGTTDHARTARATGFEGAIIILAEPVDSDEVAAFLVQGSHFSPLADGPVGLEATLRRAVDLSPSGHPIAVEPTLARTRRLVAAGELSIGLRHALNNPLTALLAEAQLMQIDARDDETRAAARRILDLVRRLTEVSRSLDSVRDR